MTSSDLKRERLFFSGSVSTFLQLVVPTFLKWIEPNFLSHGTTLQHARPTDGLTPDCVSPLQSLYGRRSVVRLRQNLIFLGWRDYQIFSEIMWTPCLYCPSAPIALQHGGCVPRERLAAKGLLMNSAFVGYEELSRSRRVLSTEAEGRGG